MFQNIIQNAQCIVAASAIILTFHKFIVLFNKWYYPYFIEKINLRPTDDFDKRDFKNELKQFFLLILMTCVLFFIPLKWSASFIMMGYVTYQIYEINYLTLKLKKIFGLTQ